MLTYIWYNLCEKNDLYLFLFSARYLSGDWFLFSCGSQFVLLFNTGRLLFIIPIFMFVFCLFVFFQIGFKFSILMIPVIVPPRGRNRQHNVSLMALMLNSRTVDNNVDKGSCSYIT